MPRSALLALLFASPAFAFEDVSDGGYDLEEYSEEEMGETDLTEKPKAGKGALTGTVRDTIAYANAVQTQYELKQSASSAGLSVSGVGSLSLPWTSRNDSLVKVGAETVSDPDFYTRFFKLMENHAPRVGAQKKAAPSRRGNLHDW